jgi:tRNA(adenine34) deaminase
MPKKFSGQARLPAQVKKLKKLQRLKRGGGYPFCNYVTFLTVVTWRMRELPPDEYFMREALRQAQKAYDADEVPIGAVVVHAGHIIARASNQVELLKDATAHAEMLALTQAEAAVGNWRLTDCDLYVTKEPCPMCAGALVHTRVRRVIFGCADPAAGAAGSVINLLQMPTLNHRCDVASGVLEDQCAIILQDFFRKRRGQIENREPETLSNHSVH